MLDYPVTDGFLQRSSFRCNLQFLPMAVENYELLRRSGAYRTKMWTVPEDSSQVLVPQQDSYEYQVFVKPGAAIWGYQFIAPEGSTYSFQVREACTGVPLFSEPVLMKTANRSNAQQYPLSRLLVVPNPGLLSVEICNLGSAQAQVQLILLGGEPVDEQCMGDR